MSRRLIALCVLASLLLTAPASAQQSSDDTTRDPITLAAQLLNQDVPPFAFPDPPPLYDVGDEAEFWVGKAGSPTPTRITARLAAISPGVYLWLENGLTASEEGMALLAEQMTQIQLILRLRDLYGAPLIVPGVGSVTSLENLIDLPNVDGDRNLYILFTTGLGNVQYVINHNDSVPADYIPGGYSNERKLVMVNTSALPGVPLTDTAYVGLLIRAIFEYVAHINAPEQTAWLRDMLGWSVSFQLQSLTLPQDYIRAYFRNPGVSLIQPSTGSNPGVLGGQKLFIDYLNQRFEAPYVLDLFTRSGEGVAPLNDTFTARNITDPLTGEIVTLADVFSDFTVANVFNAPFGDGRFVHRFNQLPEDISPAGVLLMDNLNISAPDQGVGQYGARYYYVTSAQPASIVVSFEGHPMSDRLWMDDAREPQDRFYWSGSTMNQHVTLTRAFDLRDVDSATLTFDTWYDLSTAWNYGYVMVSADDGATWNIIDIAGADGWDNRYGVAYGPGFTGLSTHEVMRPMSYMGIQYQTDGMTITEVIAGSPAAAAGLRPNDRIIGYDGALWPNGPDIAGLMTDANPGDTLDLYIQRGSERLSVPLILGEHPERVILPQPEWLPQSVDLSAYAGREVLLRFAYVSMPGKENPGLALDNIAIPEINYLDDAEGESDWRLHGWQQVDNRVAQNFLVNLISNRAGTRPLIRPADDITSAEWTFSLQAGEMLVFVIAALNDNTTEPAYFDLTITQVQRAPA